MKKRLIFLMTILLSMVCIASAVPTHSWSDSDKRDESWGIYYSSETEFTIEDAADFAQFAYLVNSGKDFSNKTVRLSNNIDYIDLDGENYSWKPIGGSYNLTMSMP